MKYSCEFRDILAGRHLARITYDAGAAAVIVESEGSHNGTIVIAHNKISRPAFANGLRFLLEVDGDTRTWSWKRSGPNAAEVRIVSRDVTAPGATSQPGDKMVYIETQVDSGDSTVFTTVQVTLEQFREGLALIGGLY